MRLPFRQRRAPEAPTAKPGPGSSRHSQIAAYRQAAAPACQALIDAGRHAEAYALYASQADTVRKLLELSEQNNVPRSLSMQPELDVRLAWATEHMAIMNLQLGQVEQAVENNAEALRIYWELYAEDPWFGQFLAICLLGRVLATVRVPDLPEANSALEVAVEVYQAIVGQQVPDIPADFPVSFARLADAVRGQIISAASGRGINERGGIDHIPAGLKVASFADGDEAVKALRGYVMPPGKLTPESAENAPEVLPGLVLGVATNLGEELGFLPYSSMVQAFGDPAAVRRAALDNLRNLDGIDVVKMVFGGNQETESIMLTANDPFVSSRCAVLPWLVERVHGAPAPHGVLLIVPIRGALQFHVIRSEAALPAARALLIVAREALLQAPEEARVSPDVFMVAPDGRAERAAYLDENGNVVVSTGGLLGEALYGSPPNGLNLSR